MFVKPGTGFQKLLDKKPLRTTAYGDSKGLMLFRKFMAALHHCTDRFPGKLFIFCCFLLENNLIGVYKSQSGLGHLFYVFPGTYIFLIFFQFTLPDLLCLKLSLKFRFLCLIRFIPLIYGYNLYGHNANQGKDNQ